ncbi:MAG TPA: TolC family outer membrane protein [Stellaceae bacterium]|nr:TolC family outer membrane protein [Stellaceae bacterium]
MLVRLRTCCAVAALLVSAGASTPAGAETLTDALSQAYQYNPQLLAQRAQLRATDEGVPQALSGWRPTVQFTGSAGKEETETKQPATSGGSVNQHLTPTSLDLNITEPIWTSGRTPALVRQAEHNVIAQRAQTVATEEQVLFSVAQAYLDVVRDQATVDLNINNEQVLRRQLEATNDQFRVGEVTRTDVAQAESRLALAVATRVQAEGNLQVSRANYYRAVGHLPEHLSQPTERVQLPDTRDEALALARAQNPNVVIADYTAKAAEDNVAATRAQLGPQVAIVGDLNKSDETLQQHRDVNSASVIARLTVPLYEAGSIYAQTRAAKQTVYQRRDLLDDARRAAIQSATRDWETIQSGRAQVQSLQSTIRAAAIALEGVRQEAQVGSRTVLDVLNAEQELFTDRVNLVQAQHDLAVAEFDLAQQVGRLTAEYMKLPVQLYDPKTHYDEVRNKWIGFGSKGQ